MFNITIAFNKVTSFPRGFAPVFLTGNPISAKLISFLVKASI